MVTTPKKSGEQTWTWSGVGFTRQTPSEKQTAAPESSLLYKRARYYDPALGEFISRDPLGFVDGMSQYRAYFSPGATDPSGMQRQQFPPLDTNANYHVFVREWENVRRDYPELIKQLDDSGCKVDVIYHPDEKFGYGRRSHTATGRTEPLINVGIKHDPEFKGDINSKAYDILLHELVHSVDSCRTRDTLADKDPARVVCTEIRASSVSQCRDAADFDNCVKDEAQKSVTLWLISNQLYDQKHEALLKDDIPDLQNGHLFRAVKQDAVRYVDQLFESCVQNPCSELDPWPNEELWIE